MRDVHRCVSASTCQCRHRIACKLLTPSDPLILAGTTSDDMGAALHVWLRLVDVAGIEGRENFVTSASARTQAPSIYFPSRIIGVEARTAERRPAAVRTVLDVAAAVMALADSRAAVGTGSKFHDRCFLLLVRRWLQHHIRHVSCSPASLRFLSDDKFLW